MTQRKLFEVGDDILEKVAKSFGRTVQSLNQDVDSLKEWMKTQPHLPEIMGDKKIQNFLLLNKCSIEKTKSKIDMYYSVRSDLSDICDKSNPKSEAMKRVNEAMYLVPLPKLTDDMSRVFVFKGRDKKLTEDLDPSDVLANMMSLFEVRISEDVAFTDTIISDCQDFSIKYFMRLGPTFLYKFFISVYRNVYSTRFKAIYVINAPAIMEKIISIIKTLIQPKLFERIQMSKDSNILDLPKEILPKEYGGEEISFEEIRQLLLSKYKEYQNRFDQLDVLRVNENVRPQKLENDDMLGFHGSFKKLEID